MSSSRSFRRAHEHARRQSQLPSQVKPLDAA
jgi:hypothetical protein